MDEQTQPTKEIIQLYAAGAIPGIGGEYGAGRYEIDYVARTATPVDENGQPLAAEPTPEQETTPTEETQTAQQPEAAPTGAQPAPQEETQA